MEENDLVGFFGGGGVHTIFHEGEVYLNADDVAELFAHTAVSMAELAMAEDNAEYAEQARTAYMFGFKLDELRMELLRREIEKSL